MAYGRLVDKYGLSNPNTYLAIEFPASQKYLIFRIAARANSIFTKFTYGPMPITSGQSFNSYNGGSITAPAANVLPQMSYMAAGMQFAPPTINGQVLQTYSTTDMWYTPQNYNSRLIEEIQVLTPTWTRIELQIPSGVVQGGYQLNKVTGGIQTFNPSFGITRGSFDTFHIPYITYGFKYGNDTNMPIYPRVVFYFAEYIVEIPKDPELIWAIINHKVEARSYTMPYQVVNSQMEDALVQTYGITGFPSYGLDQHDQAVADYSTIIGNIAAGV